MGAGESERTAEVAEAAEAAQPEEGTMGEGMP